MLNRLDSLKRILPFALLGIAAVLCLAIVFGGIFFDLDFQEVVSWFGFIVAFIFILAFVCSVIAFIIWFLFSRPVVFGWLAVALISIFLFATLFLWIMGKPLLDVGAMLDPLFSIFK